MPIVDEASSEDFKHLLELFPAAKLKERWPDANSIKDELCKYLSEECPRGELIEFVANNFSCCKQHVYILSAEVPISKMPNIIVPSGEKVYGDKGESELYLIRVTYTVVFKDPPEKCAVDFLWPAQLQIVRGHLVVKFVTLEKDLASYFNGRPLWVSERSTDEEGVLATVAGCFASELHPTDLHKGIKKLWNDGFMDSSRTKYKKPHSTAFEAMDEEKGIRETNNELYKVLKRSPLLGAVFHVDNAAACTVTAFSADPSKGRLVFPRYTIRRGDTHYVIDEILRNSK